MKCLVLAGGRGDGLWPLSRKEYPKQFIRIQKNHSIFQETIARNLPFCDEFIIVSGVEYQEIIEEQMKEFQGITYRMILEEISRNTTAAICLSCMQFPKSELMFVVASDIIISGESYKEDVLLAKEYAKDGFLVSLGSHNFNKESNEYGDSGMFLFEVGTLLVEFRKQYPFMFSSCQASFYMRKTDGNKTWYSKNELDNIPYLSIEESVFYHTTKSKSVSGNFTWKDIGRLEDLPETAFEAAGDAKQVTYQCENTIIINSSSKKIVVANELKDILIVNTEDAVYIGKYGSSDNLKKIMEENPKVFPYFHDESEVNVEEVMEENTQKEPFIKLTPCFKDYIWGGNKLCEYFNKQCDYTVVAESWELSAHKSGSSIVNSGIYKGVLFEEYLKKIGKKNWGWKCQSMVEFPILIKLIDAKKDLSVQVHPADEYALEYEHQYGKNEMWHILECEEGAGIYCGFKEQVTKEQVQKALEENTILELLNWIPVSPGETYFIEAGCVHAIGKGVMICEIQQSSDVTYRLYDYNRLDKYGNKRMLHLEQALEVLNFSPYLFHKKEQIIEMEGDVKRQKISSCKYFESVAYDITGDFSFEMDESSFYSIICTKGSFTMYCGEESMKVEAGESIFLPMNKAKITGNGEAYFIVTHV
ncbi:MAG: type I phosphomannose isomerase catalytic subunit [Lachnospiraceae bacterium]